MKRLAMTSGAGAGAVDRLIGASRCLIRESVVEKLLGMRAEICAFNADHGLRTALWYGAGWFLQWHEGPAAAVEQAWRRARRDRLQAGREVIHRSRGPAGLVDALHLCTAHNRDTPKDVEARIRRVGREHELGWSADPSQIWQRLSAPCLVDRVDAMAAVTRDNVVAVTSEFTESVDLVKAIAQHYHAAVTYQRFADGDLRNGDIGAAYVDVEEASHVTRVQALSKRALGNSMVRVSLQYVQCVVLLLGARPDPAARLAVTLAELLSGMPVRPAVRLVGPCRDACEEAARALAAVPGIDLQVREIAARGAARVLAVLEEVGVIRRATPPALPCPIPI